MDAKQREREKLSVRTRVSFNRDGRRERETASRRTDVERDEIKSLTVVLSFFFSRRLHLHTYMIQLETRAQRRFISKRFSDDYARRMHRRRQRRRRKSPVDRYYSVCGGFGWRHFRGEDEYSAECQIVIGDRTINTPQRTLYTAWHYYNTRILCEHPLL